MRRQSGKYAERNRLLQSSDACNFGDGLQLSRLLQPSSMPMPASDQKVGVFMKKNVVVVGGGAGGQAVAKELQKLNKKNVFDRASNQWIRS